LTLREDVVMANVELTRIGKETFEHFRLKGLQLSEKDLERLKNDPVEVLSRVLSEPLKQVGVDKINGLLVSPSLLQSFLGTASRKDPDVYHRVSGPHKSKIIIVEQ
jgi:hypothetical protein